MNPSPGPFRRIDSINTNFDNSSSRFRVVEGTIGQIHRIPLSVVLCLDLDTKNAAIVLRDADIDRRAPPWSLDRRTRQATIGMPWGKGVTITPLPDLHRTGSTILSHGCATAANDASKGR